MLRVRRRSNIDDRRHSVQVQEPLDLVEGGIAVSDREDPRLVRRIHELRVNATERHASDATSGGSVAMLQAGHSSLNEHQSQIRPGRGGKWFRSMA